MLIIMYLKKSKKYKEVSLFGSPPSLRLFEDFLLECFEKIYIVV